MIESIEKNKLKMQHITYSKEYLKEIRIREEDKVVNNIVNIITYHILDEAKKSHQYEWKDTSVQLNNFMYDKLFNKITAKFPDIIIEEYDDYAIKFDWD